MTLAWISRLPLGLIHGIGGLIGWLIYAISPRYRDRVKVHAARAGLTRKQRRAAVAHAGRMATEMPWLWLRSRDRPLGDLVHWEDASALDRAVAAGKGLVLLTPHLGCFEALAMSYAERWGQQAPMTALYRPARQAWLSQWQLTARSRPGLHAAPASMGGVRQMLRALRRGETLGLLPDQVPPEGLGEWIPFFGVEAYTMTLAAKLILQTGAPWMLLWAERLPRGRGWVVHVQEPPIPPACAVGDLDVRVKAFADAINREMERLIQGAPEQYLWGYNRYKEPRKLPAAESAP